MVIPNSLTAGDRKTEMHEPSKAEIIVDGDDHVDQQELVAVNEADQRQEDSA